jgi:hypothetical protein
MTSEDVSKVTALDYCYNCDYANPRCRNQETADVFAELCCLVGRHGVQFLRLLLIGPHVRPCLHNTTHSGLCGGPKAAILSVQYSTDLYHERVSEAESACPLAVFCFDAGVWGYDSWLPTLSVAVACSPVIITSYNGEEAADDLDTLEDALENGRLALASGGTIQWSWGPEKNPFGSRHLRQSATIEGKETRRCIR